MRMNLVSMRRCHSMSDFGEDVGRQMLQELRSGKIARAVVQRFDNEEFEQHKVSANNRNSLIEKIDFKSSNEAIEFCRLSAEYGIEAHATDNTVVIRQEDFDRLPISGEIRKSIRARGRSPRLHTEGERCRKASANLDREASTLKIRSFHRAQEQKITR